MRFGGSPSAPPPSSRWLCPCITEKAETHIWSGGVERSTWSVNKVMRLIQYNSVFIFKLQIEFVPFRTVPLGGYTSLETLFPLFVAALEVAKRNRF